MNARRAGAASGVDDGVDLDVLIEASGWSVLFEPEAQIQRAATAAVAAVGITGKVSVTVLLTDDAVVAELNRQWRGKDRPTNVLSFPAAPLPAGRHAIVQPLGDIALAWGVVAREAQEQGKTLENHLAHLIVHGVLHLAGHEHETDEAASAMQALEIKTLTGLGIPDPYEAVAGVTR
jgi:probable rRNA maturation factor